MSVTSKVITLNTPCVRTQRTLIWLQKQDQRNWKKWDAVVTSLEDYIKWYKYANIVGIILDHHNKTNTFYDFHDFPNSHMEFYDFQCFYESLM